MYKYLSLFLYFLLCGCHKENDFLSLSNEVVTFDWRSDMKEIMVESNISWYISSKLPSWISIKELREEGTIYITVADNETENSRVCNIVFTASNYKRNLLILQRSKENLRFIGEKEYQVSSASSELMIGVEQNIDYKVYISENARDWVIPSNQTGISNTNIEGQHSLILRIADNLKQEKRYAKIAVYNEIYNLSDTIFITQQANTGNYFYVDGQYKQFQQAKSGNGVNLIIMGDGFTQKDLEQGGRYETIMQQAADYFFSIEPYQSYRDYFNVYMVVGESAEEGIGTDNTFGMKIKNKFGTTFGSGTAITCDDELCFEYARKVEDLPKDKPLTIIIPLNSTKYAGTTYLYANGNSIALCPMSAEASPNDFEGLIHHEAGGHGFGFLCDEYVYYKTEMPESRKKDLREWQKLGFQCNLDFTNDLSAVLWKDFIGIDKYRQVGAYEGGYEYQYGVWRSEANSCMNDNIPYYNVQSRWSIVSRIMKLAGVDYTVHDFIEADHVTWEGSVTRSQVSAKKLPPLGAPKWIK